MVSKCPLIFLALLVALVAWAAMHVVRETNYGFKFTPEQLADYNKLQNCSSRYRLPLHLSSTFFAPTEDIEVDLETDMAFLSISDIQTRVIGTRKRMYGAILTFQVGADTHLVPVRRSNTSSDPEVEVHIGHFNPLGISLLRFQGFSAKPTLYVHAVLYDDTGAPSVSIMEHSFYYGSAHTLLYQYNIKHKLIFNPNDVAAISPHEFYITNSHTGPGLNTPLTTVLDMMGIYTGDLVYCNAQKKTCRKVLDGLAFANSVYLNHDHTKVYITETFSKTFSIYKRDITTSELLLEESIYLGAFLDNINVDPLKNIWVAGTMDGLATLKAIQDPTREFKDAPGIVFRLVPKTHEPNEQPPKWNQPQYKSTNFWVEIVYADNGSSIAPISVAAPTRLGQVFLGGLIADDIYLCDIPDVEA